MWSVDFGTRYSTRGPKTFPLGTEVVTVIERWLRSTVTLGSTVVTVLNNVNTDLYKNCNLLEMNVADGVPI